MRFSLLLNLPLGTVCQSGSMDIQYYKYFHGPSPNHMIAPNFVGHNKGAVSKLWAGILKFAGIKFEHQWTPEEYLEWLEGHGWKVTFSKLMPSRISLMYVECERDRIPF